MYAVRGELFLAFSNDLVTRFDYVGDPTNVAIVLTQSTSWDASTVATSHAIGTKYAAKGQTGTIVGLNDAIAQRHERLAGHLGGGH